MAQTSQGTRVPQRNQCLSYGLAPTESVLGNKELLGRLYPDPKLLVRILSELQTSLVLGDPGCGTSSCAILCPHHPQGLNQDCRAGAAESQDGEEKELRVLSTSQARAARPCGLAAAESRLVPRPAPARGRLPPHSRPLAGTEVPLFSESPDLDLTDMFWDETARIGL